MKSPRKISEEIKNLKKELKEGTITKEEAIGNFKGIINDISNILGNSHSVVIELKTEFSIFLKRTDIINNLDTNIDKQVTIINDLNRKLGLI